MFFEYRIKEGEEVQLHPPCARSGTANQPARASRTRVRLLTLPIHATRCLVCVCARHTNQIK